MVYSIVIAVWSEVKVIQLCPTLCHPMDYTVHGILQARILEWVTFPFSRGCSQPRDRTQVSCTAGRVFTSWATKEAPLQYKCLLLSPGSTLLIWPHQLPLTDMPPPSRQPELLQEESREKTAKRLLQWSKPELRVPEEIELDWLRLSSLKLELTVFLIDYTCMEVQGKKSKKKKKRLLHFAVQKKLTQHC